MTNDQLGDGGLKRVEFLCMRIPTITSQWRRCVKFLISIFKRIQFCIQLAFGLSQQSSQSVNGFVEVVLVMEDEFFRNGIGDFLRIVRIVTFA